MSLEPTVFGYSAAAVLFLSLAFLLLTVWRKRFKGQHLFVATTATAVWAASIAYTTATGIFSSTMVFTIELARDALWLLFLSSVLAGGLMTGHVWLKRYAGVALALTVLVLWMLAEMSPAVRALGIQSGTVLIYGSILTSLYALVSVEQLYRNARENQLAELKHICLGMAGLFGIDLLLYSNAVFAGELGAAIWDARGFVVAMCMPLIAVSVQRRSNDSRGLFLSRQVVFYTATLAGAGVYLTLIGAAGYAVQTFGLEWAAVLEITLLAGALMFFLVLAMSERLRARIRVFIVKHFFESKYDYRQEWLKLIETLTVSHSNLPLQKRAIQALAHIIGSPSGTLWQAEDDKADFEPVSAWNMRPAAVTFEKGGPFIGFLQKTGWIIDIEELQLMRHQFDGLYDYKISHELEAIRIIIPLMHESELVGVVGLSRPSKALKLNFEDHDLLKTAGKQIAGYLVQDAATELLAESRQFEAFNRLTAYVMHDLKNAIAQQTLIVTNAEKHKRNPEFIDDAIDTIKGSVARIRRVVSQLQQGLKEDHSDRVDVGKIVLQAASASEDRQPVPTVNLCEERLFVRVDSERLYMALCHAIRNAQDATASDGRIDVVLSAVDSACIIRISDTGSGMSAAFIRDRLFRPFDSTKGTQGMGIGAYQIRETIRSAGGQVRVESMPESGTSFFLTLPLTT